MAINDILPLKAANRNAHYASADLKSFGTSGHQGVNLDGFIYIRYAAPPYSVGTIIIVSVYKCK